MAEVAVRREAEGLAFAVSGHAWQRAKARAVAACSVSVGRPVVGERPVRRRNVGLAASGAGCSAFAARFSQPCSGRMAAVVRPASV